MGQPMRVLLIDDRIPVPSLGAGFPRMYDFVTEIANRDRTHVVVLPTDNTGGDWTPFGRDGIEIVRESVTDHLSRPDVSYDLVVISRPNNYDDCAPIVRSRLPHVPLVYDAEALFHRRMTRQLEFVPDAEDRTRLAAAADAMKTLELDILARADLVVCLSEDEAAIARQMTTDAKVITKIPFLGGITWSAPSFEERKDIVLVASWVSGPGSPNVDGLTWFLTEVFPLVQARVPWAQLRITGGSPPELLTRQEGFGITFEGHVPDLRSFYQGARCVIVPLRFGSGVKIKTMEALQYGVPVVATSIGAEGIDLHDSGALSIHDEPEAFSQAVCRLLLSPEEWLAQRSRIMTLHRIWDRLDARRPSWTEVIETAMDRRTLLQGVTAPENAHAR